MMTDNENELQKELKNLRMSAPMDKQKKESIKSELRKHAAKKRRYKRMKQTTIWFSSVAALVIFSVILMNTINDGSIFPAQEHSPSEYSGTTDDKTNEITDNDEEDEDTNDSDNEGEGATDSDNENEGNDNKTDSDDEESEDLEVNEQESETKTVVIEGMEEERTVTNYTLEPYGVSYQMSEIFDDYTVDDNKVEYKTEEDTASVTLEMKEKTDLESVKSELQSEYTDDFDYIEEPTDTPEDENAYEGIQQQFSDPPQGYYIYQIGDDVLVIQYEYILDAADGMGPTMQDLRESIEN